MATKLAKTEAAGEVRLEFSGRALRDRVGVHARRRWFSRCGKYLISEYKRPGEKTRFYAQRRENIMRQGTFAGCTWEIIGKCRAFERAVGLCAKAALDCARLSRPVGESV